MNEWRVRESNLSKIIDAVLGMIAMVIPVMMTWVVFREYGSVNDGLVRLCEHNDPLYAICNIR